MADVLVVAELLDGTFRRNTLSAVTFAKQVAEGTGGAYDIIVVGEGAEDGAAEAAKYGARTVFSAEVEGGYLAEKIAATVAAKAEDGANIFRVEASLNELTDLLRPGMQGVAKVDAGRARLVWIWTHEIVDWLRLRSWAWLP